MPEIFKYTDYRLYLRDFYKQKKAEVKGYSYQLMAQKMSFKAKDFAYRVIHGQKSLSASSIAAVSIGLGHSPAEGRYFCDLVCFNQSKSAQEKEFYYNQLNMKTGSSGINKDVQKINQSQLELFSEWYHLAIRSLIETCDFSDDYGWLARQLHPAISKKQARHSIEHLVKLGLIQKDENGFYRVTQKGLSTDSEVDSVSLVKFYQSCARLSTDALNQLLKKHRNISGVTLGISQASYLKIVDEVAQFRKKIGAIAREDDNPAHVYQMHISLFPFTNLDRGRNQG